MVALVVLAGSAAVVALAGTSPDPLVRVRLEDLPQGGFRDAPFMSIDAGRVVLGRPRSLTAPSPPLDRRPLRLPSGWVEDALDPPAHCR